MSRARRPGLQPLPHSVAPDRRAPCPHASARKPWAMGVGRVAARPSARWGERQRLGRRAGRQHVVQDGIAGAGTGHVDIAQISAGMAGGNVHGPAERDREMGEVAADAGPFALRVSGGLGGPAEAVAEGQVGVDMVADRLNPRPSRRGRPPSPRPDLSPAACKGRVPSGPCRYPGHGATAGRQAGRSGATRPGSRSVQARRPDTRPPRPPPRPRARGSARPPRAAHRRCLPRFPWHARASTGPG